MKDAGLEDVKKDLAALKSGNPLMSAKGDIAPSLPSKSNDFDKYFDTTDEMPKP